MMPVISHFDHPYEGHADPQSRRMAMMNRARRDEMDAMLFGLNSRQKARKTGTSTRTRESLINRMRAAIGNTLIAAGNRIQSAH